MAEPYMAGILKVSDQEFKILQLISILKALMEKVQHAKTVKQSKQRIGNPKKNLKRK